MAGKGGAKKRPRPVPGFLAWVEERFAFEGDPVPTRNGVRLRIRSGGRTVTACLPAKKPWIRIYPEKKEVFMPLWFAFAIGLERMEDYRKPFMES